MARKFEVGDLVVVKPDVSVTYSGLSGRIVDVDDSGNEYIVEFDPSPVNVLHEFYFTEDELE